MAVHSGAGEQWVYLKEEVEAYVKKMNETYGGRVLTWGMTGDYAYWRDHPHHTERPPVNGEIDWSEYANCNGINTLRERETDCTGLFTWNIQKGINTPFYLSEVSLVPKLCKGLSLMPVNFNVSGLRKHSEEKRWGHSISEVKRRLVEHCALSVKIDFDGYFVYDLSNTLDGNFQWIVVSITKLEDESKGLVTKGGKLTYFAQGSYTEQISCDDGVKSGKVG
nr:uncharacterized protein LOC129383871 [Dermacentor andersoni]